MKFSLSKKTKFLSFYALTLYGAYYSLKTLRVSSPSKNKALLWDPLFQKLYPFLLAITVSCFQLIIATEFQRNA